MRYAANADYCRGIRKPFPDSCIHNAVARQVCYVSRTDLPQGFGYARQYALIEILLDLQLELPFTESLAQYVAVTDSNKRAPRVFEYSKKYFVHYGHDLILEG